MQQSASNKRQLGSCCCLHKTQPELDIADNEYMGRKQIISAQNSIAMDVTHPVAGLDRPTENTAKGIKSGAVLLGVQLGNVHQQRTPGVAVLYVPHNLSALRTRIDSCNLQRKEHGLNADRPSGRQAQSQAGQAGSDR
ncbi:MAG: hypothetical protein FRX49_07610 [Trebouxia sp. A1-2]|nr:MAG: hypothetical protein FRX49_07610 [Trebouxia sp. A1-2]